MSSQPEYLDGNAAAGELSKIFAMDITGAEGQCAQCGVTKHFCRVAHLHAWPRSCGACSVCEQVLLRAVSVHQRVLLDLRGMTYLSFDTAQLTESGR